MSVHLTELISRNTRIFESKGILAKTKEKEAKCLKKHI